MRFTNLSVTHETFADSIDQDQTAQNMQSNRGSTQPDEEIFPLKVASENLFFFTTAFDLLAS